MNAPLPSPAKEKIVSALLQAWQAVLDPLTRQPLVHAKNLQMQTDPATGKLFAEIALPYPARSREADLRQRLQQALASDPDLANTEIRFVTRITAHAVPAIVPPIPGVKNIIAVASAKGGVGKSTTAANLALALAAEGAHVGLLDADIYGPSVPLLMNVSGREPEVIDNKLIIPLESHGIRIMSMGFLVGDDKAVIWRAPMALKALNQLLHQTRWGTAPDDELDYLIVDMPPGTGDIQLTMSQRVPLNAAVMVTTPQDLALVDVHKGVIMFRKVHVPVLGMVENMAVHICSNCGHHEHIFGAEGGKTLAQAHDLPYLGALPLAMQIREQSDAGTPTVVADPEGEIAHIYRDIALQVAAGIAQLPPYQPASFPTYPPERVAQRMAAQQAEGDQSSSSTL
ncbi:MAG: iron-sulfur cluster carrier protein ApbC [Brachymonas sp.]|nr:iron-sulfur cluster carrier protein ApbC [Brachymonas sp.]